MRKAALIALLGFSVLLGVNAYSQSPKEEIPEPVKEKAAEYLKSVRYCDTIPVLEMRGDRKSVV